MPKTIELNDAIKGYTLDQDKIINPETTVRSFKEKLTRLDLDILAETVRIDNGRLDIPVYFSRCGKDAKDIIGTKKQMGKGATPQQAEASAVMELAERFSFFSYCQNPQNFKVTTLRHLAAKNETALPFAHICASVHDEGDYDINMRVFEDISMRWCQAYNLTQQRSMWIPFDWFYMINEFNGPSAGNCVEEALSQGICEIVERHVSSLISHQKLQVPRIDPASSTDPLVVEMLSKYKSNNIEVYLSDFSLDMGIPSVGVLAYDPTTFPQRSEIVWTAGTTPDPDKALSRALTETAQLAGDFNSGSNYVASGLPKFRRIEDADYIMSAPQQVAIDTLPDVSDRNIKVEVQNCISALKARKMDVYVIDTKHALLQIPAFYTIIPGAHFRERSLGTSVGMFAAKLIATNASPEMALKSLATLEKWLPNQYYINFFKGACHLRMNAPLKAYDAFEKALSQDPTTEDRVSIYSYMGVCQKELGNYANALKLAKLGLDLDAERTDLYNLLGFCHYSMGEYGQAIESFQSLLKLDPSSAIDYANIASNYRKLGEKQKAIHYYETALALDPAIDFAKEHLSELQR